MARIVYNLNNGIAENIRFAKASYALRPGESELRGDVLPSLESLSDPAAWAAQISEKQARVQARESSLSLDDLVDMLVKKGALTQQEISKARADKTKGKVI
jgi:hypothetical protein